MKDSDRSKERAASLAPGNESYWLNHLEQQVESGQSKASYCRAQGLNYDQALYWFRKLQPKAKASLIAVKVKPETISSVYCRLQLPQGLQVELTSASAYQQFLNRLLG